MDENKPEDEQENAGDAGKKDEEEQKKGKRIPRWFLIFSLIVVVLIVVLLIVLFSRISGPAEIDSSIPAETFTVDLGKVLTPADLKLVTSGAAQVEETVVAPTASYALYNPAQRRLELGFFRTPLSRELIEQLAKAQSFSDLQQIAPDILFVMGLKKNTTACDQSAVEQYQVFVNRGAQGAPEYLSMEFAGPTGIVSMGCRFDQTTAVFAALRQDAQQQVEQGPAMRVRWDLRIIAPVFVVQVINKLHYDSTTASAVVALWNKMDNVVEIGYFATSLSAEDREVIRKNKALLAVPQKKPVVTAALYLNKMANSLELASIVRYGVIFYRNAEAGLDFPGPTEKEGFYYVVSPEKTEQLFALRGSLAEGEFVQGRLRHEATKVLDQTPTKFSWDLVFDTALLDVFAQPEVREEDAVTSGDSETGKEASKEPEGPFMQASVGGAMTEFSTVVALYYTNENDVALGFYVPQLTDEEKEQVRKNRVLWQYVNNKRPNLVLFLDFRRGATEASTENLNGYTVYFNRDKLGSFFFPGNQDQLSFARNANALRADEIRVLSGGLKEDGQLTVRIKGDQAVRKDGDRFTWNVNITADVMAIR